jgi:hypothetical protein
MTFPVTNAITSLQFRYYDDVNATWVDSWGKDSREGLPRLVKIALSLRSPEGAEEDMTTIVAIRSATRD